MLKGCKNIQIFHDFLHTMYICNIEIYNLGFSSDFKGAKYNEKQGVRENVKMPINMRTKCVVRLETCSKYGDDCANSLHILIKKVIDENTLFEINKL